MMPNINGYTLTTDWKVVGGMSEIAFAEKDGKEWFIKKFISPKYPTLDSPGSERIKAQKKKNCEEFETRQRALNSKIGSKCGFGGNLVYAVDFFRVDTCYYKINEKIDASSISLDEICKLNRKDIFVILKSLVHSLRIMHRENIVHGDLKPDNILIKTTPTGSYTTKLIDFDDSYFSGNPPKDREQVVGTPEYYSPELFDYISDEDDEIPGDVLTLKSDIFALGIIFTEYLTGSKPIIPSGYSGTYSAVKDNQPITFKKSTHLTTELEALLQKMLLLDASKRPTIDEVFLALKDSGVKPPIPKPIECKVVRFVKSPSSREGYLSLEWDVEGAKEVRINGGFPLPKRGKKDFSIQDKFILTAISLDGKVMEQIIEGETPTPPTPTHGGGLRGKGLNIGK